jgi:predicted DNA-binding antitoxin AbrB/MazE fold protein
MIRNVEAVYEHGVLRPLEALSLSESQRVNLIISDVLSGQSQPDLGIIERARVEAAAMKTVPTIDEVRAALASITGSLSHDVIAERGEYWLAQYFLDTSAAVKYYHAEAGTPIVSAMFVEPDRKIRISSLGFLKFSLRSPRKSDLAFWTEKLPGCSVPASCSI